MRSVASMMEDAEDKSVIKKTKVDNMIIDDNSEMERHREKRRAREDYEAMQIDNESRFKKGGRIIHCCNKSDGKGWHCKNEPREGHSMCDHHLNLMKSYSNNSNVTTTCLGLSTPSGKKPEKGITGVRRGRAKAGKRGSSSNSNPYEFYYYSGFGPLWRKRRGDRGEENKSEGKDAGDSTCIAGTAASSPPQNTTPSSTSSPIEHNEEFDYVDEDDDDDDDDEEDNTNNNNESKKRTRKPVKARSLKSLM